MTNVERDNDKESLVGKGIPKELVPLAGIIPRLLQVFSKLAFVFPTCNTYSFAIRRKIIQRDQAPICLAYGA